MKQKIKIAVIDDHSGFRNGIISVLDKFDGIEILSKAKSGKKLIDLMENNLPDLVLLNLGMKIMDGVQYTEALKEKHPKIRILIYTLYCNRSLVNTLCEKGADGFFFSEQNFLHGPNNISIFREGFILREENNLSLVEVILTLMKSNNHSDKYRQLQEEIRLYYAKLPTLSRREKEIIRLICDEYTTQVKLPRQKRIFPGFIFLGHNSSSLTCFASGKLQNA